MTRKGKARRPDATGRSLTSRFVRLDHRLLRSNSYRGLYPNARALLVELAMLDNGSNNGSLYLSVRDAAHRMGVADLTAASRAFDELAETGFIEMTQEGHFNIKASEKSRARCWRLTWLAGPGRKQSTWDMLEREPAPQTKARKRMERGLRALKAYRKDRDLGRLPVLDCDTVDVLPPILAPAPVLESDTANSGNGSFLPKWLVRDSATHLAIPWGRGTDSLIGWWQPDCAPQIAALAYASALTRFQWSEAA
ncbi:hypothetical protein [Sphingopyxis sp.]|uniref:hypothetical protein n=1 Tax=Sphingopyxis sp. TaxID=1908224 RepID=UPI003D14EC0A